MVVFRVVEIGVALWYVVLSSQFMNKFDRTKYLTFLLIFTTLCIVKVPLCLVELYQTRTTVDSQSQEDYHSLAPCKITICISVFVSIYVFVFLFSPDDMFHIRMSRKGNQARTRVSLVSLPLQEEKIRRSWSVGSAMILTGTTL